MRTKEELQSPEFNDDMSEFELELKKRGIKYTIEKHLGALEGNGRVKEIIGYYPTGEWQIHTGDYSIIRGYASFGQYEIMRIKGSGKFEEPERFKTAKELVDSL